LVAHGVAQGPRDVVLPPDVSEALRPVPPVERLVGLAARVGLVSRWVVHHGKAAYGRTGTAPPAGPEPTVNRSRPEAETDGGRNRRRPKPTEAGADGGRSRRRQGIPEMSEGWSPARRSGDLRHTLHSAESCCRQALTRFTVHRCAGPDRRARRQPFAREDSVGGCSDEEGCESGRIGTIGNRVWGNPPWVQIPPSPLCQGWARLSCRAHPGTRSLRSYPSHWAGRPSSAAQATAQPR
jgi:hypothetical protein